MLPTLRGKDRILFAFAPASQMSRTSRQQKRAAAGRPFAALLGPYGLMYA
jgi:hypothetical protein